MDVSILNLVNKNISINNASTTDNNNTYKTEVKSSKNQSKFDDILSKTSSQKEDFNTSDKSDTVDNSKFQLNEETKQALKEAGLSDKDIENIKSLDDLKNVIAEKLLSSKSKDTVDVNKLLLVLSSFLNVNTKDLENVKQNIVSEVKDVLNSLVKEIGNDNSKNEQKISKALSDLGEKVKNILNNNLSKVQEPTTKLLLTKEVMKELTEVVDKTKLPISSQDIMPKIKQEVALVLNETLKTMKSEKTNEVSLNFDKVYENIVDNKQSLEVKTTVKNDNSDSNKSSLKQETSKDNDFLKSLAGDGNESKEDKFSKVTNFMNQFNNNISKNAKVADVENMVINKNNIATDVIKSIKYMQLNNIKDLTVKIMPKELGEVVIKLTMEGNIMKANITASNKDAFNLLNSNMGDITNKLQSNDIKIQDLSLNIYNEDTTFFKDGSNKENKGSEQKNKKSHKVEAIGDSVSEVNNHSMVDNNVNMLA